LISTSSPNGVVTSTDRYASEAGIKILREGGNAIDAAIAIGFAMAVSYPSCGNIGGGGFLMYHSCDGFASSIDYRITAPKLSTPDMFLDENGETDRSLWESILVIGTPGTVDGFTLAHKKWGDLPWSTLLEPSIRLAVDGFVVNQRLHNEMKTSYRNFLKYKSSTKALLNNSKLYKPGETWRQPDLAETLMRIQEKGGAEFYTGETARLIVDYMEENGGIITLQDLGEYRAIERAPLKGTYKGCDVFTMRPPSSGVTLLEMLNILEGYDLSEIRHDNAQYAHLLTETMGYAFLDRLRHVGDPDFGSRIPLTRLTSKAYASSLRAKISLNNKTADKASSSSTSQERMETTHYNVVDDDGNSVSVTYTLDGDFGSEIVAEGTGIILNNEMQGFDFKPRRIRDKEMYNRLGESRNLIEPGKRPISSMIPTIISKDDKPILVLGSPGGTTIVNTILQIILNHVDHGMNVVDSISAPRMHYAYTPDYAMIEPAFLGDVEREQYKEMGHSMWDKEYCMENQIPYWEPQLGTAMGIQIDWETGVRLGCADPRSGDPSAFST
jgi:gamma-glutamyltranspeptidase/glutathione hydrolase